MITEKRRRGDLGEKKALEFLRKRGFKIVQKNYQNKYGEIDIICKRGGGLYFMEVKSTFTFYSPEENMTRNKMNKILRTSNLYLLENNIEEIPVYFDLVSVNFKKGIISLYPNINTDLAT